jgi:hypothetical protein
MKILRLILAGSSLMISSHRLMAGSLSTTVGSQAQTSKHNSDSYAQMACLPSSYEDAARRDIPRKKAADIAAYRPKLSVDDCSLTIVGTLTQTADGRAFVFISPEGLLVGVTVTPLMREKK